MTPCEIGCRHSKIMFRHLTYSHRCFACYCLLLLQFTIFARNLRLHNIVSTLTRPTGEAWLLWGMDTASNL